MATSKEYLGYVLDLLSDVQDVNHRAMMGEYVLYASGKVFGGIYDDRLLVKPTESAKKLLPSAEYQVPYEGAKPMLLVDIEDKRRLAELIESMLPELPAPKQRKRKS